MWKKLNTQNFAARQLEGNYGSSGGLICKQCTKKNEAIDLKTWTCYKCKKIKDVVEFSNCQSYLLTSNERMQSKLKACNHCWKKPSKGQTWKCFKCGENKKVLEFSKCESFYRDSGKQMQTKFKNCNQCWKAPAKTNRSE